MKRWSPRLVANGQWVRLKDYLDSMACCPTDGWRETKMSINPIGEWVRYSDYVSLMTVHDALQRRVLEEIDEEE